MVGCVDVLSIWVRMGRRQVGSQRSPWESLWVDRVSSQSPWTGAVGRAGRLWSTQWGSWDCWRCDAGYSAILLVEMVKSCPWNLAPAGTWTSSTLLLGNVLLMALESNVGQTSPRVQAGLWNYLKKSSSHSVITEEEQHLESPVTTACFSFPIISFSSFCSSGTLAEIYLFKACISPCKFFLRERRNLRAHCELGLLRPNYLWIHFSLYLIILSSVSWTGKFVWKDGFDIVA